MKTLNIAKEIKKIFQKYYSISFTLF